MRNGSGDPAGPDCAVQILKFEQHGEDTLELAIEMHLVAGQPVKPMVVQRLAEGLRPDQIAVLKLAAPPSIPGRDVVLERAPQALTVGPVGLSAPVLL